MKYILIILLAFLTACGGGGGSDSSYAFSGDGSKDQPRLLGDSRCVENTYISNRNCVGKRKLIDINHLEESYDTTVIALGINDIQAGVSPAVYKAHLSYLIANYDGEIWCVLESTFNYIHPPVTVNAYRQAMLDVCPNTLDPNIDPFNPDKVHYTDYNYQQLNDAYLSITD